MMRFSAVSRLTGRPVDFFTVMVSGVTAPETIASPSPQAPVIITSSRRPVTGLAVNITPAASANTNSCTITARATSSGAMFCLARYAMARAVQSEAQQRLTASSTACSPRMFR